MKPNIIYTTSDFIDDLFYLNHTENSNEQGRHLTFRIYLAPKMIRGLPFYIGVNITIFTWCRVLIYDQKKALNLIKLPAQFRKRSSS